MIIPKKSPRDHITQMRAIAYKNKEHGDRMAKAPKLTREQELAAMEEFARTKGITVIEPEPLPSAAQLQQVLRQHEADKMVRPGRPKIKVEL